MLRRVAPFILAGCSLGPPLTDLPPDRVETFTLPQMSYEPLDLVFAIENSPAMAPHRDRLLGDIPRFIDALQFTSANDLRVAAITADAHGVGCSDPGNGGVVLGEVLVDRQRPDATHTSTLDELAGIIGSITFDGCDASAPFSAIERLLDSPTFRRPGAALALIIVTTSDDHSTVSPDAFVARLADEHVDVYTTAIHGDAPRIEQVLGQLPDSRTTESSIDDEGFNDYLQLPPRPLRPIIGNPCAVHVPSECTFSDVTDDDEHLLPGCDDARPCWRFAIEPTQCPSEPYQVVVIDRDEFPPPGTRVTGQCTFD